MLHRDGTLAPDARAREAHQHLMLGDPHLTDSGAHGEWWRRTDGQPGLSWPGAIVVGVIVAAGFFVWAVVTDDGPIDGDAVGAAAGGLLVAVLARFDIRGRVRRRGGRDVERIRWRRALRRTGLPVMTPARLACADSWAMRAMRPFIAQLYARLADMAEAAGGPW